MAEMRRTKTGPEGDGVPEGPGVYFCVSARNGSWCVSTVMAKHIEDGLSAVPRQRWIRFVDLSGASIKLRTREIDCLVQSTPEQRAFDRAFGRSMREERKADRNWEEDD